MLKIKFYCILSAKHGLSLEEQAEQCCLGGADAILLTGEMQNPRQTIETGLKIREITRRHKVLFFVEGRPDIAVGIDADGVHLGPDDVSFDLARQIIGPRKLIGSTASSLGQAVSASELGASYVMIGPLFSHQKDAPGVDIIRLIKKRVKAPVIACGDINFDNTAEIMRSGADGIAVSDAVLKAQSVSDETKRFKARVIEIYAMENPSGAKE